MRPLAWIGARAQWVLSIGVVAALFLPGPGAWMKGTLPFWVTLLLGLSMTRIDLGAVVRRAVMPRRLLANAGFLLLLMVATPVAIFSLAKALGAAPAHVEALVYTTTAPPFGSAAAICLILWLDAAFAVELTVLGTFLAPFTMPVVAQMILGTSVSVDMAGMFQRLALMTVAATAGAVLVRHLLGSSRIDRHRFSFDGLSSICMILFLFPLFEGIAGRITADPAFAMITFMLAIVVNLGVQIAVFPACRRFAGRETGGTAALVWGNRNVALALASLPPDPLLTLYVALYQFPMYFTPLIMRPIVGRRA